LGIAGAIGLGIVAAAGALHLAWPLNGALIEARIGGRHSGLILRAAALGAAGIEGHGLGLGHAQAEEAQQ